MIDLSMSVKDFRCNIEYDENLQNFIKDILVIASEEKLNRAYYKIEYHLLGKNFPEELRNKIIQRMQG